MWIVTLHHCDDYGNRSSQKICGCITEENADSAGKQLVAYYNRVGLSDSKPALIDCDHKTINKYSYSVHEHNGEWL